MPPPPPARSAYLHIPFCRRRCYYCDFAISVVGDRRRGETSGTIRQYVDTLLSEIQATPQAGEAPLKTIFFGGGTPSLLAVPQLEALLSALDRRFGIAANAEISMEMDPATFDLALARGYSAAGINRVSLGAQAFQDELLAACGRCHRRADIFQAADLLHRANIENFSLDLISGLPHQTLAHWQDSLTQAIALGPTHISQYDLVVEPKTAFAKYFTPGRAPLPSDEQTAAMYRMAARQLTAKGYEHYEICNYAQPGYAAQHNLTYWRSQPCYGFGMGATSYLWQPSGPQRIDRPRTQRTYRQWVEQFVSRGGQTSDPALPATEQVMERIMVGLRLKEGIALEEIARVYGAAGLAALGQAIAPHVRQGWAVIEPAPNPHLPEHSSNIANQTTNQTANQTAKTTKLEASSRLRLSDPEGFLMSSAIIVDAFNALEPLAPIAQQTWDNLDV